jgi:hypothetical protein
MGIDCEQCGNYGCLRWFKSITLNNIGLLFLGLVIFLWSATQGGLGCRFFYTISVGRKIQNIFQTGKLKMLKKFKMGKSHFFEKKLGKCLFRIIIFLIFRLF